MINVNELNATLESVKYGIAGIESILSQREFYKKAYEQVKSDLQNIDIQLEFMATTKKYYAEAVDILYQESIGALKDTLDAALQYIMFDKNYSCNIVLDDKRGTKTLELNLIDNDEGLEQDLMGSTGQGVRAIYSFVLKTYYLINRGSSLLFLDEKYSALSEHYIPRFFEFVKQVADERGLIIVMITHDMRFTNFADKGYIVNDGEVTEITQELTDEEVKQHELIQNLGNGVEGSGE